MKSKPITRRMLDEIVRLRNSGISYNKIGEKLGYSGTTIAKYYYMETTRRNEQEVSGLFTPVNWSRFNSGLLNVSDADERIARRRRERSISDMRCSAGGRNPSAVMTRRQ